MEALCLSFVCHLVCELLLFEPPPPPKKYRGKLLLFSRGRGDGPTTLSAYSLLLMHGLLLFARPTPGRAHLQASDLPCACYPHCFCHLVLGPCWGRYVCPLCATSCMSCCCSSPPPEKELGQVVVVLAGPGGWVYHSFCFLFAPRAWAVAVRAPPPARAFLQEIGLPCACSPHCFCLQVHGKCWRLYVCPLCATSCASCCSSSPPHPRKKLGQVVVVLAGPGGTCSCSGRGWRGGRSLLGH